MDNRRAKLLLTYYTDGGISETFTPNDLARVLDSGELEAFENFELTSSSS